MKPTSIVDSFQNFKVMPKRYTDVMQRVVIVGIDPNVSSSDKTPGKRDHFWGVGYAVECLFEATQISVVAETILHNEFDLWCFVESALTRSKTVHLIGQHMSSVLTLTRFWEELETGRYYLVNDEWRMRDLKPMERNQYAKGLFCIEDPPIIIHCWNRETKGRVVILDIANYCAGSVDLALTDADREQSRQIKSNALVSNRVQKCCEKCTAVGNVLYDLQSALLHYGIKTPRSTIAGSAYDLFLRRFHDGSIHHHDCNLGKQIERHGLYAGICEVFKHGAVKDKVHVLDVNSLYPYVMSCEPVPTKLLGVYDRLDLPDVPKALDGRGIIAECRIATDTYAFPFRYANGVCYPVGDYWTVLASPEFMAAWDLNLIREVRWHCLYEMGMPFKQFVESMYLRRNIAKSVGDSSEAGMYKLLMNTLAGRFAKRGVRWIPDDIEAPIMPWGVWAHVRSGETLPTYYRAVNWDVERLNAPCEGRESCPAIFAHITSSARCYMRYLIDVAGAENVYYMDTDSMHVSEPGLDLLRQMGYVNDTELGKLKVETVSHDSHYYGIKDYRLENTVCISGMSSHVDDQFSRSPNVWVYPRLQSLLHYRPNGVIRGEQLKMNLSPCHVKGEVMDNGRVEPHRITEDYTSFRLRLSSTATRPSGVRDNAIGRNPRKEVGR